MNDTDEVSEIDLFKELKSDLTNLHLFWKVYAQLFAHSEKRVALLNETGPLVFHVLQRLLLDEATLAICRLTDPEATGKKRNHGLPLFVVSVTRSDKKLGDELKAALELILPQTEPFRQRRNRAIAHSDLAAKLKIGGEILPGISREMVDSILSRMRDFMNLYDRAKFDNATIYEEVITALGSDGDFLAEQLKRAVAFRDLERDNKLDRRLWTEGRYRDA